MTLHSGQTLDETPAWIYVSSACVPVSAGADGAVAYLEQVGC